MLLLLCSFRKVITGSRFFPPSLSPPFHYVEHVLLYLELGTIAEYNCLTNGMQLDSDKPT